MADEVDRFPELFNAIRDFASVERVKRIAKGVAEQHRAFMIGVLRENSPVAGPDTFVDTGHADRSILESWRYGEFFEGSNFVEAGIANDSPHVNEQRYGTRKKGYAIPHAGARKPSRPGGLTQIYGQSQLRFWLGPPLKWPVRAARFRKGGFVYMDQVRHPGFGPWGGRDFVEVAADEGRPQMVQIFNEEMRGVYEPLEKFFG